MNYLYRGKQFYTYYTAKISDEDWKFLSKYLNEKQLKIFLKLPLYEQRHSLDVAYNILNMSPDASSDLVIAALMHDIGKGNSLTPMKKAIAVLLDKLAQSLAVKLSKRWPFLYTYYNHPAIGGKIAAKIGLSKRCVYLIEHHNDKNPVDKEIIMLQKADGKS
ncbi:HD domain-containing protein [Caldanaerobius polysaccharolyticus]|uniref:HD domain-containing protein n=1 Tax=Caldanaerobius polysaccharolyticus TaxID=44256 RepID=UPI0006900656|nr:HD domain-containing protein [Caldanaerobius polysaccharolyticus]